MLLGMPEESTHPEFSIDDDGIPSPDLDIGILRLIPATMPTPFPPGSIRTPRSVPEREPGDKFDW